MMRISPQIATCTQTTMQRGTLVKWMTCSLLALLLVGCRAHPASLAMMVIGDAVNDSDVNQRAGNLVGKNLSAADTQFGTRIESLEDTRRRGRWMTAYPVQNDLLSNSRYVVESQNGRIVALTKTIRNIDGAEDLIRSADLRSKLIGRKPRACERAAKLGRPRLTLRNLRDSTMVRVYEVHKIANLGNARCCVLRFDGLENCRNVDLVGVSASTKSSPLR